MDKETIIALLKQLNLPLDEYYVLSSCSLELRGIPVRPRDLDLCVSDEQFDILRNSRFKMKGPNEYGFYSFTIPIDGIDYLIEVVPNSKKDFKAETINVKTHSFDSGIQDIHEYNFIDTHEFLAEVKKHSHDEIHAIPVQDLNVLLNDLMQRNLPKDEERISRIFGYQYNQILDQLHSAHTGLSRSLVGLMNSAQPDLPAFIDSSVELLKSYLLYKKDCYNPDNLYFHQNDRLFFYSTNPSNEFIEYLRSQLSLKFYDYNSNPIENLSQVDFLGFLSKVFQEYNYVSNNSYGKMPEVPTTAKQLIDAYLNNVRAIFPDLEARIKSKANIKSSITSTTQCCNDNPSNLDLAELYFKKYLSYLSLTSQLTSKLMQTHLIGRKYGFRKPYESPTEYPLPSWNSYEKMIKTPSSEANKFLTPLASYLSFQTLPYRASEKTSGQTSIYPLDLDIVSCIFPTLDISQYPTLHKTMKNVVSASYVYSIQEHRKFIQNNYNLLGTQEPLYLQDLPFFSPQIVSQAEKVSGALLNPDSNIFAFLSGPTIDDSYPNR